MHAITDDHCERQNTNGDQANVRSAPATESECTQWTLFGQQRSKPPKLSRLLNGTGQPLLWAVRPLLREAPRDDCDALVAVITGDLALDEPDPASTMPTRECTIQDAMTKLCHSARPDALSGIRGLALAHRLRSLHRRLDPLLWERVWSELVRLAAESRLGNPFHDTLAAQLHTVELPLTLGHVFANAQVADQLRETGRDQLEQSLTLLVNEHGMAEQIPLNELLPLLACWTRSLSLAAEMSKHAISKPVRRRFRSYLLQLLRFLQADHRMPTEQPLEEADRRDRKSLLRQAARLVGYSSLKQARSRARKVTYHGAPAGPARGTPTLFVSDVARYALLRSSPAGDVTLACDYSSHPMVWELSGRKSWLRGDCHPTIVLHGQPVTFSKPWHCEFEYSDEDVDCVELETNLTDSWKLQRTLLLGKKDRVLFVADAVLGEAAAPIEYECVWRVPPEVTVHAAEATREVRLQSKRASALMVPLAAREWRLDSAAQQLVPSELGTTVRQDVVGTVLYCPVFVDLDTKRSRQECTWRQLTVAEALQPVPADRAVGYRIRLGRDQFVLYRSFTRFGNRTFLGINTSAEFHLSRLRMDGTNEPLLEVVVSDD